MSTAKFGDWETRVGDPTVFCFSLAFLPNPDGPDDRAAKDERESWGSFAIWVGGENLCAHIEQGEVMQATHWYMLPFMEWIADNWDPLMHEERLPLRNAGISAAESLSKTRLPAVSLKLVDDFEWYDTWSDWWSRHSVRAAREGGLFPDLYLRRYRDKLEVSTGAEPLPGIPSEFAFLAPNRTYHTELAGAAESLYQVLFAGSQELRKRLPQSTRVAALARQVAELTSPDRERSRLAWLAGPGNKYAQAAGAVQDILSQAGNRVRRSVIDSWPESPLVTAGSAYARLLYGAANPITDLADVVSLTHRIVDNYVEDATPWLSLLNLPLDTSEVKQLSPGEQGSRLGEKACELIGGPDDWIDIESVARKLDISVSNIELSDPEVRAVSVFGPTQRPHILRNTKTRWARSLAAKRFTLAHELCHLLLDREHGNELAVASGPWAPLDIEQRAKAFAAAFLMPTWLLRDAIANADAPIDNPETIRSVSTRLRVSASSLIDRLYNLGEITFEERIQLRSVWPLEGGQ